VKTEKACDLNLSHNSSQSARTKNS